MKLGTKIILGFASACVIFVLVSAYIVYSLTSVQRGSEALEKSIMPAFSTVSATQYSVAMEAFYTVDYDYSSNPASWEAVQQTSKDISEQLRELKRLAADDAWKTNSAALNYFQSLEKNYSELVSFNANLPRLLKSLDDERSVVAGVYDAFLVQTAKIRQNQTKMLRDYLRNESGTAALENQINRMLDVADLETVAGEYLIFNLRGLFDRSADMFDKSMEAVAKCQSIINRLLEDSKSSEEKAMLTELLSQADSCGKAVQALKTITLSNIDDTNERTRRRDMILADVKSLQETIRDLTMNVTTGALNSTNQVIMALIVGVAVALVVSMALALVITRGITRPINRFIETLSDGAQDVDGASGQLSSSSNTLAEGATENAASLEETSAALEELSSMTKRNADNAMEAHSLMEQTKGAVVSAEGSMSKVIQAMTDISVSGNEIGKIIKTIDEIAFQTNLLALNAAVEAARAGDAGAGFAVVADEVRNLAIRSADAAKNTADLIASTIANINSGSEMVNATAENFKIVGTDTYKVAELLAEVSEASKEQSQGIGQITTAMTEMDKVTQSNAASAEESASAAGQLSLQAGHLLEAVEGLKGLVHGNSAASAAKPRPKKNQQVVAETRQNFNQANALLSNKGHVELDDNFDF